MDKIQFGNRLKFLRNLNGLTQEKFAELVNIDMRQIARIEAGQSMPSLETFLKVCKSLKITPNEFLEDFNINPLKTEIYDLLCRIDDEQLPILKKIITAFI